MAPAKTNLPAVVPSLVNEPTPLIIPEIAIFPVFLIPKVNPPVLTIPPVLNVNALVAASLLILDAVAAVTIPEIVAADEPLTILIAPGVATKPVPLIVIASGIPLIDPFISKAAPLFTVVVEAPTPPALTLPNASLAVTCITPVLTKVAPAYVFEPPNINIPVPDPSLVIPPTPLIALVTEIFPVLDVPNVSPPVFVIAPVPIVKALVAASLFILDAVATVIAPDKVAAPEPLINLITPGVAAIPVPLIVIASPILIAPLISNAAPVVIVVAPVVLPKAVAFVACSTPVLIVVIPA